MSREARSGVAMPLDTGGLNDLHPDTGASGEPLRPREPDIHSGTDVGQALRAMREHRGLTLDQLAEATRVRSSYLAAIEEMRLEGLPSRPFVIGYIRAYAQALGADPDQAADRFKAEEPVLDEPLPEPVGVRDDRDPRLAAIFAGAIVILGAIIAWNVVQRIMTESAPPPPTASETASDKALANTTAGPVSLGAPLPAPVESTTPPPYITPGLEKATNAQGQPLVPPQPATPPADLSLPQTFTPRGQIYGVGARQGAVILQTLKPAFLVVHGADGSIYFARQLNEGEAYRAPNINGMTIDVSEPDAFQVFSGGQSHGVLPQPITPVNKLVFAPPAPPAQPKPAAPAGAPAAQAPAPVAAPPAKTTATTKPPGAPTTAATKPAAPKTTAAKPAATEPKAGSATANPAATTARSGAAKPGAAATKPAATTTKPKPKAEAPKPAASKAAAPKATAEDEQPPF